MQTASMLEARCLRQHNAAFSGNNVRQHSASLRCTRRQQLRCTARSAAPAAAPAAEELRPSNLLLVKAVEALFSIKPIFASASKAVRTSACP